MSKFILEFEKPIKEIKNEIKSLKDSSGKTGIDLSKCEVLKFTEVGTFSEINRDPRGRYISVVYSYELMYKPRLVLDPKEVKSALWMDISDIYRGVLAFDHYEILLKFLRSF